VGVDLDGTKHVLGIWVQASEGAKFWAGCAPSYARRGVRDVLIVCCDGLTGFLEAIEATWPQTTVQTCTVHLIRAAMRFVSYQDRNASPPRCARSTPPPGNFHLWRARLLSRWSTI
jgi:putative transposase